MEHSTDVPMEDEFKMQLSVEPRVMLALSPWFALLLCMTTTHMVTTEPREDLQLCFLLISPPQEG